MSWGELLLKTRYYRWFPPEEHLGFKEEYVSIDCASAAMLLVDVYLPDKFDPAFPAEQQNDRLSAKDYHLWRKTIVEGVVPALTAARRIGLPVIYVCNRDQGIAMGKSAFAEKIRQSLGFKIEDSFKSLITESLREESGPGQTSLNFIDSAAPREGDYIIGKTVYSGFFNTPLDSLLRNLSVRTLFCAGFRLDACLLGTVLDALYRNYRIVLIRDAVLASELPHELDQMSFTERMIIHFEAFVGTSTTGGDFVAACEKVSA